MYKLTVFIPKDHSEKVKKAMFEAGGGQIGSYDCCCFELEGQGQFRACEGATPYIGKVGTIEYVTEKRVEMVVADENISSVVLAMKEAHPYEEVAYDLIKLTEL